MKSTTLAALAAASLGALTALTAQARVTRIVIDETLPPAADASGGAGPGQGCRRQQGAALA